MKQQNENSVNNKVEDMKICCMFEEGHEFDKMIFFTYKDD